MVIIYEEKINRWRAKQRFKLESFELPNIAELATGRSFSTRLVNLFMGVAFLLMIAAAYIVLTIFLPDLKSGMPKIFAFLVFFAIVGSLIKASFAQFAIVFGKSRIDERYWNAGIQLYKEGKINFSIRCCAEALTNPWIKRPNPRNIGLIINDLLPKAKAQLKDDQKLLLDTFSALLFSEMFLDIKLNSDSAVSGLSKEGVKSYRSAMMQLASDSNSFISLATMLREMAEVQKSEYLESVLEDWAKLFNRAPQASKIIAKELPVTIEPLPES